MSIVQTFYDNLATQYDKLFLEKVLLIRLRKMVFLLQEKRKVSSFW